jgi:predicted alpha/beta hydrolase family esterase
MIIQNKILLKRLILVAPPEGKHERLQEFFAHLNKDISQIKNYVDEVIVLYSTDDTEGRVEASKRVIEETGAFAIKMENYGHFNVTESKLIE